MFEIKSFSQIHIYLTHVQWQAIPAFAASFMDGEGSVTQNSTCTFEISAQRAKLRAERFVLCPELLPWEVEIILTFDREGGPLDPWLALQLASDFCEALSCQAWCDPPQMGVVPNHQWKIRLQNNEGKLHSELVELKDLDIDWVEVRTTYDLDLRNLELYQTRLPYWRTAAT